MKPLRFCGICCLLLAAFIELVQPTCVLESDFGFKINCAFKKSSLFRVRNLGGIKAHASLGFSLGDELGFEQSLTNLDPSRRRSVSVKNGVPPLDTDLSKPVTKQEKRGKQNRIMMRPATPTNTRPNQAAMDKLSTLHKKVASTMRPIIVGSTAEVPATYNRPSITLAKPLPMGVPAFKPLPPKEETLKVLPLTPASKKNYSPLQIPQSKGPGLAYQSENYPQSHNQISKMVSQMTAVQFAQPHLLKITPTPLVAITPKYAYNSPNSVTQFVPRPVASPPTQGLSVIPAPPFKEIQTSKTKHSPQNTYHIQKTVNPVSNFVDPVPHQVHDLASKYGTSFNTKKVDDYNSITGYGDDTILKFNKNDINAKIVEIAKAGNISMEAVEAAIALRQQQLLSKYANMPVPTTTTTTTTEEPVVFRPQPEPDIIVESVHQKPQRPLGTGKVMNAPKEYYPIGYEKNFDDHFHSKVDLPDTNFHCGDQKYFPGLYGDENLGCMVFHVCALTDDGLVMKSFLCPESTLFDQTILKCNWWFYVDCKNTRKLYDTNIPVSKSYQLMKALTFFSSYKKEMQEDGRPANPEVSEGIKDAISILENQKNANSNHQTNNAATPLRVITPQSIIDEINKRNNNEYTTETSPVYRAHRHLNNTSNKNTQVHVTSTPISQELLDSAYKFVTLNADLNYNKYKNHATSDESSNTSDNSKERKHKRRQTLRNSSYSAKSTTTEPSTTTGSPVEVTTFQIIRQEIQPIENYRAKVKQDKLTDQLDNSYILNPASFIHLGNLGEVKRFYRSSAERPSNNEEREMAVVNNEKVQIIRPTSSAKLVGQYATTTAAIAKLDEAVLGKRHGLRFRKDTPTIVTRELRSQKNNQT